MSTTWLSIWSSSSELAIASVETQCCLRRGPREAKTTEPEKFQCNVMRICCSKDEWKMLEGTHLCDKFLRRTTRMFQVLKNVVQKRTEKHTPVNTKKYRKHTENTETRSIPSQYHSNTTTCLKIPKISQHTTSKTHYQSSTSPTQTKYHQNSTQTTIPARRV